MMTRREGGETVEDEERGGRQQWPATVLCLAPMCQGCAQRGSSNCCSFRQDMTINMMSIALTIVIRTLIVQQHNNQLEQRRIVAIMMAATKGKSSEEGGQQKLWQLGRKENDDDQLGWLLCRGGNGDGVLPWKKDSMTTMMTASNKQGYTMGAVLGGASNKAMPPLISLPKNY